MIGGNPSWLTDCSLLLGTLAFVALIAFATRNCGKGSSNQKSERPRGATRV